MGNRRQETGRIAISEIEKVRDELGDEKAIKLRQLREYSKLLMSQSLHIDKEGKKALAECLSEANEILAEAGLVSSR